MPGCKHNQSGGNIPCKPDPATKASTQPNSPNQPGADRIKRIRQNIIDADIPINTAGVVNVVEVEDRGGAINFFTTSSATRKKNSKEDCQKLIGTLSAIAKGSPVLKDKGADLSKSVSLRQCLFATTTEFSEDTCRHTLRRARVAATKSQSNKAFASSINQLKRQLGEKGECPFTLSLLNGSSDKTLQPVLNITRSGDVSNRPNLRNVLNDYINVQYHISMSMVPERESRRLQTRLGRAASRTENETINDLLQESRRSGSVTLASTGEYARNERSQVEDEPSRYPIENIDLALADRVEDVSSGLEKLAKIWNNTPQANITGIINSPQFNLTKKTVARETLNIQLEREATLAALINQLQARDFVEELDRTEVDVSGRNYYNIKSLRLQNVHGPSYSDPFVSNLTTMEMNIVEPHGLSFHQDLVTLAKKLGYDGVNPGRVLYKIDVWFSGYDPYSGEWVWNIPVNDQEASGKPVISYYVVMTGVEANLDVIGTEYKVTFAPQGFQAIRPEEFSLQGTTITTGEDPTFGSFLRNLSKSLNKKRKEETKEALGGAGINRIFKFYAPDVLMQAPFYQEAFLQRNNLIGEDAKTGGFITIGKDIDVLTLLRSVLADLPEVQTAFLTSDDNKEFLKPVVHFTVRFNTRYITKRPEINDYDGIVYEYIIEPFLTYKKLGFDASTVTVYSSPESQEKRIRNMLDLGMIQRMYDYINTSENTDVLNFDVKLNSFYYETFRRSFDPGARKGLQTASTPSQVTAASNSIGFSRDIDVNLGLNPDPSVRSRYSAQEDSLLQKVFGTGISNQAGTGNKTAGAQNPKTDAYGTLNVSLGTTNDPVSHTATMSDGSLTKTKDEYLQRFNDHFALDLLTLESLEVKGDPVWLMTPYGSSNNNPFLSMQSIDITTNEPVDNILQPHGEKVIYLNIKETEQLDYMNQETLGRSDRGKPNIIAGFYGIIGSESVFEDGKFTQKLNGYKMAHLNYAGNHTPVEDVKQDANRTSSKHPADSFTISEWTTQVLDQAENLPDYAIELEQHKKRQQQLQRKGTDVDQGFLQSLLNLFR